MGSFKKLLSLTAIASLIALPILALAQSAPPSTVDEGSQWVGKLMEAIASGNYLVVGGIVVMLLMVAVKQYLLPKIKVSEDLIPFINIIITAIGMAGFAMAGGVAVAAALKTALVTSGIATLAWEALGKYLAKLILPKV